MKINADFKFHPVGQGCFYTGKISVKQAEYNFIYDCGSDTPGDFLINQITNYQRQIKTIDLLILSHLHSDHINGVSMLLSNGIKCKRVIIPYISPIERLLIAVLFQKKNTTNNPDNGPNSYLSFLQSPINFLVERGVEEVIVINNDKGEGAESSKLSPINPNDLKINESIDLLEFINNNIEDKSLLEELLKSKQINSSNSSKVKCLKYNSKFLISYIWELCFFNKAPKEEHINAFQRLLHESFPDLDELDIINTITDNDLLDKLKLIYKLSFPDVNLTSLCLYHGSLISNNNGIDLKICPCCNSNIYCPIDYECCEPCNFSHTSSGINYSTLLTGDYKLNTTGVQNELYNYYENRWRYISLFQMPHHGSKYSWPYKNRPNMNYMDFDCYILNFGLGNRNKHPHQEIINILEDERYCNRILLNHQLSGIYYQIEVL